MNLDTHLVMWILIIEIIDFIATRIEWWLEFKYDKNKDDLKKQKKTRTTKKTTTQPSGESTIEESTEITEPTLDSKHE